MNTIEKKSVNAGKFVTKQEVDTLINIVQTGKMGCKFRPSRDGRTS